MGRFRFHVVDREQVPPLALASAYLSGMEGIPWRGVNTWLRDSGPESFDFAVDRNVQESGNLSIPWRVEGYGEIMLATASLMETEASYHLPLELARGALNRVRNQFADWRMMGLVASNELSEAINKASAAFIDTVTLLPDDTVVAERAQQAMRWALEAGDLLCRDYTQQAIATRRQTNERIPAMLACQLGGQALSDAEKSACAAAFNTAVVPFAWRMTEQTAGKHEWDVSDEQIEWCKAAGLRVVGGPLLQLDAGHLPDWLFLWEDDFEQITTYLVQHVRATVTRYRGSVNIWNSAARMNLTGSISLTEDQRLRLIVAVIDEIRRCDAQTPIILSMDQPWAEYLAVNDRDLSPLHLADSLTRADLGIAGVGIELNVGYHPGGTYYRELLEFSRQLDRWSVLGLPLIVSVTLPSSADADPAARLPVCSFGERPSPQSQADFAQHLLSLLLAKPFVQGIVWNDLSDAAPHEFAHGGLFDGKSQPKPVLEVITSLRQQHLM